MSETILIDRVQALEKFLELLEGKNNKRILRITGIQKMGKSRVLREYRRLTIEKQKSHCALVDLRSKFQNYSDVVFQITNQLPLLKWAFSTEVKNQFLSAPKLEVKRVNLLFAAMSINLSEPENEINDKYNRQKITSAFCQDLRSFNLASMVLLFDTLDGATAPIQNWLNEQLMPAILQIPKIYVVFAGRVLPELPSNWEDVCDTYTLPPATLEDHMSYCESLGIKASKETIAAFYKVFDGTPGLFAEYASKLDKEK